MANRGSGLTRWLLVAVVALVLSACGPEFAPSPSTTKPPPVTTTTMPMCHTRPCASPAAVARFLAEAERGALQPLIATYRLSGTGGGSSIFVYATVPRRGALSYFPPPASYKYETVADGLRYEFVSNSSGYFECLTKLAENDWTCRGPISPGAGGVGGSATIGSYDVEPDLTDYLGPPGGPAPITTRDVNGFRLSCISYTEKVTIAVQTWCITGRGVLGYIAGAGFLRGIELVSLSFTVPKDEFSLPSKPTRWHGFEDKTVQAFAPPGFAFSGTG